MTATTEGAGAVNANELTSSKEKPNNLIPLFCGTEDKVTRRLFQCLLTKKELLFHKLYEGVVN